MSYTRVTRSRTKSRVDPLGKTEVKQINGVKFELVAPSDLYKPPPVTYRFDATQALGSIHCSDVSDPLEVARAECARIKFYTQRTALLSGHTRRLESIEYCVKSWPAEQYQAKRQSILKELADTPASDHNGIRFPSEVFLFHGSSFDNIKSIMRDGFDLARCRNMSMGRGVYLGSVSTASTYAHCRFMLACKVTLGATSLLQNHGDLMSCRHKLHHSHVNGGIFLTNHPHQVMPLALLTFSADTPQYEPIPDNEESMFVPVKL